MRTVVPSTGRNAPPRPALASQVWGCSDGPCAAPALRMTRMSLPGAGALLARLPNYLLSCDSSERAAVASVGSLREVVQRWPHAVPAPPHLSLQQGPGPRM
jgi:hypothetical protein